MKVDYKPRHRVVIRKAQDAAEAVGKRFGALLRTVAMRSLGRPRKDGRPSDPGKPPRASRIFRRSILFAWDSSSRSVVVGPRLLPGRATKDAPEMHELGGATSRKIRENGTVRRGRVRYPKRPTMVPALEKSQNKLPELWAGAIRN